MFCNNCGMKAEANDKFCNECGSPLRKASLSNNNIDEFKKADGFTNIITSQKGANNNCNNFTYDKNYTSNYHSRKKNKKLKTILAVLTIVLLLSILTIVFINKDTIFNKYSGKRTIMIYMIGSNLESKYVAASNDIKEMINSQADFKNINILLYTGGTKTWHMEEISSDENAIFKVTASGLEKVEEYPIMDIGNADTLTTFIEYGYENYKAEHYSLILWNHGGGPIYGYGYDEYNKTNSLTLLELKTALENSPFHANNKLEFIGFDACLMATAEIAYILSDYADYMIASQEVEPGSGWNYSFLGNIKPSTTTYEIGKNIVDSYIEYYSNRINGKGISLSLLKLNRMDFLEQNLNSLFKELDQDLIIDFSSISRSRSNSKTFGKVTATGYDLVDLYDLLEQLPKKYYEKVNSLKSVIEDLVVYQKTDLVGAHGISIYFPYENKDQISEIIYLYKYFNFASEYTNFIDNFSSKLTGTRLYNWNLENTIPQVKEEGLIEVSIPEEVAENYSGASYIIFEKTDDDYYIPRFKGTDVTLNNTTLSTTVAKKALVATDSDKNEVYITALESEKGSNYTKYIIPATLQRWEEDFISDFEMVSVYLQLVVTEENPNGQISGAIEITENGISPKVIIDLEEWEWIQLLTYKYKIFDENGNYTTNWLSSAEITGLEEEINKGFTLEFKDLDVSKEYYCLFTITDSQGNNYTTNVVKVNQ